MSDKVEIAQCTVREVLDSVAVVVGLKVVFSLVEEGIDVVLKSVAVVGCGDERTAMSKLLLQDEQKATQEPTVLVAEDKVSVRDVLEAVLVKVGVLVLFVGTTPDGGTGTSTLSGNSPLPSTVTLKMGLPSLSISTVDPGLSPLVSQLVKANKPSAPLVVEQIAGADLPRFAAEGPSIESCNLAPTTGESVDGVKIPFPLRSTKIRPEKSTLIERVTVFVALTVLTWVRLIVAVVFLVMAGRQQPITLGSLDWERETPLGHTGQR